MRKRKIRKIGNSYFIPLAKSDMEDFGLVEGDIVDIDDLNMLEQSINCRLLEQIKKEEQAE